jgi:hypothetical protein
VSALAGGAPGSSAASGPTAGHQHSLAGLELAEDDGLHHALRALLMAPPQDPQDSPHQAADDIPGRLAWRSCSYRARTSVEWLSGTPRVPNTEVARTGQRSECFRSRV